MSGRRTPPGYRGDFLDDPSSLAAMDRVAGPFSIPATAVARPTDVDALAALVRWAAEEGVALVPRGGGTGMPGGNVGRGVLVDLRGWTACRADPEGSLHVGPGVLGRTVQAAAAASGRTFPALPSSADRCTVGGMIANNAAGARSFGAGPVRAFVRALDVVFADGGVERLTRDAPGPRFARLRDTLSRRRASGVATHPSVAKNASGYEVEALVARGDAVGLMVGSEGTLGIVAGAVLDTAPEPECRALALLPVPDLGDIDALCDEVRALGASACEFLGARFLDVAGLRAHEGLAGVADAAALLQVELSGREDDVARGRASLAAVAKAAAVPMVEALDAERRARLWSLRHAASPVIADRARNGLVSMQFIEDNVVPRSRLGAYLVGLGGILDAHDTDAVVFGHAGDGNVHVNPLIDIRRSAWRDTVRSILDETVELVVALGGTLSGEHGDGRLRAPYLERIWGARAVEDFRVVRDALDPVGILNPGVVLPLPGQDPLDGLTPRPRAA